MITFREIADESVLESFDNSGWTLKDCHRLKIDDQCREVSEYYSGRVYQCVAIAEKSFGLSEKITRIALGVLAVLATLGLALAFKPVRDLFFSDKQVLCLAVFLEESREGETLNNIPTSCVTAFKIYQECHPGRCKDDACVLDHPCQHGVDVVTANGQKHEISLSATQIKDHLVWVAPNLVEFEAGLDASHFAQAGLIKV